MVESIDDSPGTLRYIVYIVSPWIVDLGTRLVTLEAFKVLCLGVPYQKIKKSCGIRWFQDVSRCFKMFQDAHHLQLSQLHSSFI